MNRVRELIAEIARITGDIETRYPELYRYPDELPLTLPVEGEVNIDQKILADYLESLQEQLKHHVESH